MTISLNDLMEPAESNPDQPKLPAVVEKTERELAVVRREARARLVAQEYVRNGMRLVAAYETVTGKAPPRNGLYQMLGTTTDAFLNELSMLVEKSDVERERALGVLWAMFNTSILDFFDEHGRVLSIAELKKLPRVMQVMLSKIDVSTKQEVVLGPDKKPMLDDNGAPYLRTVSRVKIEIPEKMAALQQLAQLMRWVGPTVQVNVVNVGRQMSDADDRISQMGRTYEGVAKRLDQ